MPSDPASQLPSDALALEDEVVALVRSWLDEAASYPVEPSAARLADLLRDADGLSFTSRFIDGVIRPEDERVAARTLIELGKSIPPFVPPHLRVAMKAGTAAARVSPALVIPVVRRVLRQLVGHLLIDATDARLGSAIAKLRTDGTRLNLNLLGEAVLGPAEAARRLSGTKRLLARPDVDYVSIKVSAIVAPHSPWAFDETVAHVVEELTPLYRQAATSPTPKFINLDMEEYHDLGLTLEVFQTLLDRPDLHDLEAGIVLQAYLPDSLDAMIRLQIWARGRRAAGGAPIKVRIVKGANLAMERVDASIHGWPLATWPSKQESDTHYKRVIDYALRPEHIDAVRIGVAGHNLFDIAFAWLLAGVREVRDGVEFEMLLGMAQGQAEVVRRETGALLLYTPVVRPQEFDVAIAYLIRRLEEGASQENFMSAIFELDKNEELFERERDRFSASLRALDRAVPSARRTQNRLAEESLRAGEESLAPAEESLAMGEFANTPDTDPALRANRSWGSAILNRVPDSTAGVAVVQEHTIGASADLDGVLRDAVAGAPFWGSRSGVDRASVLRAAGTALSERRGELAEVMASECGKTLDQSDPEISEAIDFANYYAERAEELDAIDGAACEPVRLIIVVPPWNFPVAIPAGGVLAGLAAGAAVVIKPAPQARRCGAVLAETLWSAGVPRDVLKLVIVDDGDLGQELIADPRVDRLILTGAFETAELFRSFRPDLPLLAETSGKNAVVVTPSADLDLAAKDVAHSAFGHAGQKCSAASLAILVDSAADSRRFRQQLLDSTRGMVVGWPSDPTSQVGPVIEPAAGKLLSGLTQLGPGESWLLEPKQLDDSGRLWSPGIRDGVRRGSEFHLTEYFGPVLGLMRAENLDEALEMQNEVAYGLTAGLHSLDPDEGKQWLAGVQAGNLYINRGITGAIVRRQPFGGWKRSSVGPGAKAGGPNYLIGLGNWRRTDASQAFDQASCDELMAPNDVSGLLAERDVLRYVPTEVSIRFTADRSGGEASADDLVRCVEFGLMACATLTVSADASLPVGAATVLDSRGVPHRVETNEQYAAGIQSGGRVRLIGGDGAALMRALGGRPDVAIYSQPVTESGRIEILPFVKEQAISITAHRFGNPHGLADELVASLRSGNRGRQQDD